jgi:hypothetical protein
MEISEKLRHIYNYNNFVDLIVEGLIHTYPIKTTIKLIKRELNGIKSKIDIEEETGTIFLKGYSNHFNKDNIIQLIRVITLCGYFPSIFELYDEDDNLLRSFNYKSTNDKENEIFLSNLRFKNHILLK